MKRKWNLSFEREKRKKEGLEWNSVLGETPLPQALKEREIQALVVSATLPSLSHDQGEPAVSGMPGVRSACQDSPLSRFPRVRAERGKARQPKAIRLPLLARRGHYFLGV